MFVLIGIPHEQLLHVALAVRTILLPLSAVMLVIFGTALIREAGSLPRWMDFVPVVLLAPAGLLVGYALIMLATSPALENATDVWSRYLLYLPGNLLSMAGFLRQWRRLGSSPLRPARSPLLGAAAAFGVNALVAGLIVPPAPYGLAGWLNYDTVLAATGVPVQIWRAGCAVLLTFFVIRSLRVLTAEREQRLAEMEQDKKLAEEAFLKSQASARRAAEAWTNTLVEINRRVANLENVDQVFEMLVQSALSLLDADAAVLALWDENRTHLLVKGFATREGLVAMENPVVTRRLILDAIQMGNGSLYPQDMPQPVEPWVCAVLGVPIRAAALVPLVLDKQALGGLWVSRREPRLFTADDLVGLTRLADQAVIALEHWILATQMQSMAVVEERTRIAREMHDGLSQILGYLSLETQTLEALTRQGRTELILDELKQARQNILAAQADVRENILSLRTTLAGEAGVVAALQAYLEEFGLQTGLNASLEIDPGVEVCLSPLAEVQMVRIVQEALANVRKHARARNVLVRIDRRDGFLALSVTDDGVGFAQPVNGDHYGLHTMRERAESVYGGLTVISTPGEGTQVNAWLPVQD
jgi:signal transduction histidine kinase